MAIIIGILIIGGILYFTKYSDDKKTEIKLLKQEKYKSENLRTNEDLNNNYELILNVVEEIKSKNLQISIPDNYNKFDIVRNDLGIISANGWMNRNTALETRFEYYSKEIHLEVQSYNPNNYSSKKRSRKKFISPTNEKEIFKWINDFLNQPL